MALYGLGRKFRNTFLPKNQRVLRRAGILDERGVHTKEGRNLLWSILFQEYEEALVDAVNEIKQDDEDEEKEDSKTKKSK